MTVYYAVTAVVLQTTRMLDGEQSEDTQLRERFKEQWKREPSAKLTETLRKEVSCIVT
jgi:hypothetical protein